jgi:hypothetical protein
MFELLVQFPNEPVKQYQHSRDEAEISRELKIDGGEHQQIYHDEKMIEGKQHETSCAPQKEARTIPNEASDQQPSADGAGQQTENVNCGRPNLHGITPSLA